MWIHTWFTRVTHVHKLPHTHTHKYTHTLFPKRLTIKCSESSAALGIDCLWLYKNIMQSTGVCLCSYMKKGKNICACIAIRPFEGMWKWTNAIAAHQIQLLNWIIVARERWNSWVSVCHSVFCILCTRVCVCVWAKGLSAMKRPQLSLPVFDGFCCRRRHTLIFGFLILSVADSRGAENVRSMLQLQSDFYVVKQLVWL